MAATSLQDIEVPRPDLTPECKAKIGYCKAMAVQMSASVAIIQRLAQLQRSKSSASADANKEQLSLKVDLVLTMLHCVMSTLPHQ